MKNTALKTAPINRSGLIDIWNAFMVENADFSNHDIPLCPTTATSIPSKLIGYDEAKSTHKKCCVHITKTIISMLLFIFTWMTTSLTGNVPASGYIHIKLWKSSSITMALSFPIRQPTLISPIH